MSGAEVHVYARMQLPNIHTILLPLQRRQLVKMGREEGAAPRELGEDVLGDGPGEAEAVEGRGAAVLCFWVCVFLLVGLCVYVSFGGKLVCNNVYESRKYVRHVYMYTG